LGDLFKGLLPVYIARMLDMPSELLAITGIAAFIGHLYPIFFEFKGGKGVATSVGVLLGFSWILGVAVMLTWIAVYKIGKISSLAALIAAILAPFYAWFLIGDMALVSASVVMTIVLLWRHTSNIKRLLSGSEA
jgi:glycerol-3-phosphate acyltransferase PlsY